MAKDFFSDEDQQQFAALSGDWNPVHVSSVAARRTIFGGQVVHGIHLLLWSLEEAEVPRRPLRRLEAKFVRPVMTHTLVRSRAVQSDPSTVELILEQGEATVAHVKVEFIHETEPLGFEAKSRVFSTHPAELSFEEAAKTSGSMAANVDWGGFAKLFPRLSSFIAPRDAAFILATTRIVGMECPGLHSTFTGLNLEFSRVVAEPRIRFRATRADRRFSFVQLEVEGLGISGTLQTVFRPPPVTQLSVLAAQRVVQPDEFAGWHALVVGGSRGLGEVAAKLIAAGNGKVCITYHRGKDDADHICAELIAAGKEALAAQYDVCGTEPPSLPWRPTHLLYFATPRIAATKGRSFSADKLAYYSEYYVTGFHRCVTDLPGPFTVFYPSSIFLSEKAPQYGEYCVAKAAGEEVARQLRNEGIKVYSPRLPRVLTDQTTGIMANTAADACSVMLGELRLFKSLSMTTA